MSDDEQPVIGYVVDTGEPALTPTGSCVTMCVECTDDPGGENVEATIRDDDIYGDEVPYPECYDCGEVARPEVDS